MVKKANRKNYKIGQRIVFVVFVVLGFVLAGFSIFLYNENNLLKSQLISGEDIENKDVSQTQTVLDTATGGFQNTSCAWDGESVSFNIPSSLDPLPKIKYDIDAKLKEGEVMFYICLNESKDEAAFFTQTYNSAVDYNDIRLKLYDVKTATIREIQTLSFKSQIPAEKCLKIGWWSRSNELFYSCNAFGDDSPLQSIYKVYL